MTTEATEIEPVLTSNPGRFVIFPIQHNDLWELYKETEGLFWRVDEIDLVQDLKDWEKLDDDEKHFVKTVLSFFASADGVVMENCALRFFNDVQWPEARAFYAFQLAMENIHSITYSTLIDTYIKDKEEQKQLLEAAIHSPAIKMKTDWAMRWISSARNYGTRLVAFAAVEGIFFCGSFCAIFWLKKRNLMPGLTFSNELISRDEGKHCAFACAMFGKMQHPPPMAEVQQIIREAVDIEAYFVTEALPVGLIGMNAELMKQYIQFTADNLLEDLFKEWRKRDPHLPSAKIFHVANPFDWMQGLTLQGKTNFFEKRVGDYQKADAKDVQFTFDDNF